MKTTRILALALCFALLLGGCASSAPKDALSETYMPSVTAPAEMKEDLGVLDNSMSYGGTGETTPGSQTTNQKLIRTVRLDAQTQEYESLLPALEAKIASLGGYVESRDAYNGSMFYGGSRNRYCSMVIRIPANNLNEFVAHINETYNVTNTSETVEDITLEYVDTAARITALETEQKRLLELLESAESLTDLLQIEDRLSDVRYELERYASRLRLMDNQVDYATVHLELQEVQKLTPVEEPNMWQRISEGFAETLEDVGQWAEDLLVWFIVNLPWIVIWAGLGTCAVLFIGALRRRRAPRRSKAAPPQPPKPEEKQE